MKIKCDFCKTEYSVDRAPGGAVKCAVCGHTWVCAAPARTRTMLTFIAALVALMSAIVFAVAVVARGRVDDIAARPLVAQITDVNTERDDLGAAHFVVSGTVTNRSDQIYGVPDIIIVSHGADDRPIARQKFMPTATLLDAGASATFNYRLTTPTAGVKKLTVEIQTQGDEK